MRYDLNYVNYYIHSNQIQLLEMCTANKRAILLQSVGGQIRRDYRKATPRAEVNIEFFYKF